ncbi:p53 and DNA damage-regulated protein 1-like [Watersipora subatra]|uniref:p53 and DNA damage-regulated protein 1-like n=1 Tax=Watersipora subatra TaxID=2589382 RepID=UPI00355BEF76
MELNTEELLDHLTKLELAAQDLLEDKHSIVALDRKRNQTREARTAIKNRMKMKDNLMDSNKVWMCYGNTFIKMRSDTVVSILDEAHKTLDKEINSARDGLKTKLNTVREMEGKSQAAGFNLQALSANEQKALHSLL